MKKILTAITLTTVASFSAFGQCSLANLSAWSGTTNPDAGALAVTAAAAQDSTACGMEVSIVTGGAKNFVEDLNPAGEQRYRARFYLDPNAIALPTTGPNKKIKMQIAQCQASEGTCASNGMVQFKLANRAAEGYVLDGFVVGDTVSAEGITRFRIDIADTGSTRIEYDLDMTAGTFKLWVDATAETDPLAANIQGGGSVDFSGLDFTDWAVGVTRARVGFMNTPNNVPVNSPFYIDEFESRRQTFIGQ